MPPESHTNKDFLKALLQNEKKVYKITDVKQIIVPKLDELRVKNIQEMTKADDELRMYFPNEYYKKLLPDRVFFFNTINIMYPEFLCTLISGAQTNRISETHLGEKKESILITDEWMQNLSAIPFYSKVSRYVHDLMHLL